MAVAAQARFLRINTAGVRELLNSSSSPFAQDFAKFARDVFVEAQRLCPRGEKPSPLGGSLVSTLELKKLSFPDSVVWLIGTEDPRGFWVHEGTDPHRIPSSGRRKMTFYWKRVGRRVTLYSVEHPGIVKDSPDPPNKGAQPFLAQALENVAQNELGGSAGTVLSTGSFL